MYLLKVHLFRCVTGVLTSLVLFTYLNNGLFNFFQRIFDPLKPFSPFKQRKVKQTIALVIAPL